MKHLWITSLLTFSCLFLNAQDHLIDELTSYFSTNVTTENSGTLEENIIQLYDNPLNINTCNEYDLEKTGLFSAFQAYNIISYRNKYGSYLSIFELASVPGINRELLQLLEPLLSVMEYPANAKMKYPANAKHESAKLNILSNFSIKQPLSDAYNSTTTAMPKYIGSPGKQIHRVKLSAGKVKGGMAIEKDPGEVLFYNKRPEHFTGYLEIDRQKTIQKITLGNFKLHNGLGLIHGLGFNTGGSGVRTNGFRSAYARPYSSTMEYDYYRGAYTSIKTGSIITGIYISSRPEDMSFFRLGKTDNLFNMVRKTGYHRTKSELEGKNLGNMLSTGITINLIKAHGNIGIAYSEGSLSLSNKALDSLMIPGQIKSKRAAYSIYGIRYNRSHEMFFEAAMDKNFCHSILAGIRLELHPALSIYSSVRDYGIDFSGIMPSAYGVNNQPQNSSGLNVGFQIVPAKFSRLYFDTNISKQKNSIASKSPFAYEIKNNLTLKISRQSSSVLEFRLLNIPRDLARNESSNTMNKNKIQIKYFKEFENNLTYETKWIKTILNHGDNKSQLLYHQIAIQSLKNFMIKYRFMTFNVPNWESRIYLYEPGVKYSFLFPSWQGKGMQNIIICRAKISRQLTIRSKFAVNQYSHKFTTGSGDDIRNGNRTFSFELQIQADLQQPYKKRLR